MPDNGMRVIHCHGIPYLLSFTRTRSLPRSATAMTAALTIACGSREIPKRRWHAGPRHPLTRSAASTTRTNAACADGMVE